GQTGKSFGAAAGDDLICIKSDHDNRVHDPTHCLAAVKSRNFSYFGCNAPFDLTYRIAYQIHVVKNISLIEASAAFEIGETCIFSCVIKICCALRLPQHNMTMSIKVIILRNMD